MRAFELLDEYRKSISPPYDTRDLIILFLTVFVFITIPLTAVAIRQSNQPISKAEVGATMYLAPASKTVNLGESFSVQVLENSNTDSVNAIQSSLVFDANMLTIASISYTGSAFQLQAEETVGAGTINLARAVNAGAPPVTGINLIATINFTAKQNPGATVVSFTNSSHVVRSTDNQDILVSTAGGSYTIGDPAPSVTITNPTEGQIVSGTVNVTATASDNARVTRVEFYIDSQLKATDDTAPYTYSWDTKTIVDGAHAISAKAYDSANQEGSNTVNVVVKNNDTEPPTPPTNLTARAVSYNQVDLAWTASVDNIGVAGYWIMRNGDSIASTTTTTYQDKTVLPRTTYNYQVVAYDASGNNSAPSNRATVTTPSAPDTEPPSQPTNLLAEPVSSTQVNLSWTASTDNIGVVGYEVYRDTAKIALITTTSFGDSGLRPATTYRYYVIAKDSAGLSSAPSDTVTTTTLSEPVVEGVLTGVVKDARTDNPIAGASVRISIPGVKGKAARVAGATTNSLGVYAIKLRQGTYNVQTSAKGGYTSQIKSATITADAVTTINFTLTSKRSRK